METLTVIATENEQKTASLQGYFDPPKETPRNIEETPKSQTFWSKNMRIVRQYAWDRHCSWRPDPAVISAALCVKHCLERMGLKYE